MDGHPLVRIRIGVILILITYGLIACAPQPQAATPSLTEAVQVTETSEPTEPVTVEETATPTKGGEIPEPILPSLDEVEFLLNAFEEPNQIAEDGHVPPPDGQVTNLESICDILMTQDRLLNLECSFINERATTYALPEIGVLYQVVSIQLPANDQQYYNELLRSTNAWGDKGLLIGGLIVYQPDPVPDLLLPTGAFGVLLVRNQNELSFELIDGAGANAGSGSWQLRMLDRLINEHEAYTYVTPNKICFSQQIMQACLNLKSGRGDGQSQTKIQEALNMLIEARLLPADAEVNVEGALASIDSLTLIKNCQAYLQENVPKQCLPDIVATGAKSMEIQVNNYISKTLEGIGVVELTSPIENYVYDFDNTGILEVGSYRVDLIQLANGVWLAQYVRAVDLARFYDLAVPVPGSGQPVDPDSLQPIEEPGEPSQVLLDRYIWSPCQSSRVARNCSGAGKWHRDYCFSNHRFGWCDVIGY